MKKKNTLTSKQSRIITALLLITLSVLGIALFFRTTTIGDESPTTVTGAEQTRGNPTGNLVGNAITQSNDDSTTPSYNSFVRRQKEKIAELNTIIQGNNS